MLTKIASRFPLIPGLLCSAWIMALPPLVSAQTAGDWFTEGTPHLTINPRYEYGKITGLEASHAFTVKTLLGYTTGDWRGVTGLIEFSDTRALDRDSYNAGGVHGPADHTPIADPQTTELNQLLLRYATDLGAGKIGRQRYILDNARFVGNVGWRQNEQTFDAVSIALSPADKLTLNAAYLHRINRIFADAADWDSESYLLNAQYALDQRIGFTTYYYHLSFSGAVPTTDTFGGFISGKLPATGNLSLKYRLEGAYQERTHTSVGTRYLHGIFGTTIRTIDLQIGYELLGSDAGRGQFLTPLATAHAFNGFADTYLDNGGSGGLRDLYFSVEGNAGKLRLTAIYHYFRSDEGRAAHGRELDLVATYPLSSSIKALVKAAFYDGENRPDRERLILQATASF